MSDSLEPILLLRKAAPGDGLSRPGEKSHFHAVGQIAQPHLCPVVEPAAGKHGRLLPGNGYQLEQPVGGSTAQTRLPRPLGGVGIGASVAKQNQRRNNGQLSAGGGALVFVHGQNGLKQAVPIFLGKARLPGQIGAEESSGFVQAVRDGAAPAPWRGILTHVEKGGAGNGHRDGKNRIQRPGKSQLDRAADLSGLRPAGHDRPESAGVEIAGTDPLTGGVQAVLDLGARIVGHVHLSRSGRR